ncbi:hypothetical protein NVP1021C_19 [Vibrio phage 1.021.C._10N.222.51.F9]|nr:hypothetical protein NVP1021A_19 [Vibrio phage 1.021.A._10N.222.51.F9]AUR82132.1 hypothetical protein NVP1021B_19 [Vibrio phage 1.021.B._10N.222.51.F9]AUR82182.1 hypothetical protein NVP1021C_19 [Vibrio phage 1.021.C._10N.222.51.F9]
MTVNTKKITSGPYNGNGIADTFSYGFKVTDKTEFSVYETDDAGVQTLLTVDTDYTVNTVGDDNGGTITRTAGALPVNYQWYIRSNFEETQLTAFTSQGAFFPDLHELAMDKLTLLIQQILDKLGRTFRLSDSYSGPLPLSLENPDAGKVLRWNADESGIENFDTDAEYVNIGGDTMNAPLAGPESVTPDDYMPQRQVVEVVDDRIQSVPGFDPQQFIDYGLVTSAVGDELDYGSVA